MKVAVIGAGWAGCAAAVQATRLGHQVTIFEAARVAGGRARRVDVPWPINSEQPTTLPLDNGQHILIGAYTQTLQLMADVGIDVRQAFLRLPLTLQRPDGSGLSLPAWPAPFDALAGIVLARGWSWRDKLSLLRVSLGWKFSGFRCLPQQPVSDLCRKLTPKVFAELIGPLCVSALNTPPERASGAVFLRVLHDSLFAQAGGSNLLLPRIDLSAALPDAALAWLSARGGEVRMGCRVESVTLAAASHAGWLVADEFFDRVVLACPPLEAARLAESATKASKSWTEEARTLQFEAITTVYAMAEGARLQQPMLALNATAQMPAQFVFDRGQLGGSPGLLTFVVSASEGSSKELTRQVMLQGQQQLGLADLVPIQTVVEKRATFACTPGLERPAAQIAPGLLACGDYIAGPYPATLEGAVRSGLQAACMLESSSYFYSGTRL